MRKFLLATALSILMAVPASARVSCLLPGILCVQTHHRHHAKHKKHKRVIVKKVIVKKIVVRKIVRPAVIVAPYTAAAGKLFAEFVRR